jgi:hypothetical protein
MSFRRVFFFKELLLPQNVEILQRPRQEGRGEGGVLAEQFSWQRNVKERGGRFRASKELYILRKGKKRKQ